MTPHEVNGSPDADAASESARLDRDSRDLYRAPKLLRLDLTKTEGAVTGLSADGFGFTSQPV
jgi:hypothetical protein